MKFLNISNHPSYYWLEDQVEAALHLINSTNREDIVDIQFPNVPPTATKEEVAEIGDSIIERINKMDDVGCIHIMGEMNLTYFLVTEIAEVDADSFQHYNLRPWFKVVASTTERMVQELDGKKTVQFKFVQFREY
jgi:hypothetical protein